MKKGLLFILMVGASVCLSAQEKGKTEGKAYTVETNRFGANWFISGGVGGQMYFGDNDGKADFGKRDRKSTRLNSSHIIPSRMPSSA